MRAVGTDSAVGDSVQILSGLGNSFIRFSTSTQRPIAELQSALNKCCQVANFPLHCQRHLPRLARLL